MCNGFLTEINKQLPFARHNIGILKHINLVKHLIAVEFMQFEKVVIAYPKSNGIV